MGVRKGRGYCSRKPKRGLCGECQKQGLTQWLATASGMLRWCQYCQNTQGTGVFAALQLAKKARPDNGAG